MRKNEIRDPPLDQKDMGPDSPMFGHVATVYGVESWGPQAPRPPEPASFHRDGHLRSLQCGRWARVAALPRQNGQRILLFSRRDPANCHRRPASRPRAEFQEGVGDLSCVGRGLLRGGSTAMTSMPSEPGENQYRRAPGTLSRSGTSARSEIVPDRSIFNPRRRTRFSATINDSCRSQIAARKRSGGFP